MKYLFLLVALLPFTQPAAAQALRPDSLVATPAAPDTVAALHRLFAARRKRNFYGLAGTVVFGTAGLVLSGELSGDGIVSSRDMARFFIPLLGIPAAGVLAISYAHSSKKERKAIRDFQAHRLSSNLKYALSPEYFAQ